jgi:ribosomal protein S27AE
MDIGSIFLILGLLVLVALYISQPLMQRKATVVSEEEHEYSALLAERDRILNTLQELDFDHTLGKIPEESYPEQRATLLQKGAAILRQLDAYQAGTDGTDDLDSRLEAAIEARRADAGDQDIPGVEDDDLETMISNRRRARTDKSGGFCPKCGNAVQQSDRFCPKCGDSLK